MAEAGELAPVMMKLERRIGKEAPRHKRIQSMVETSPIGETASRLKGSFKRFKENPKNKEGREVLRDDLTVFFFQKTRERYKEGVYDKEKEARQIRAVTAFLEGKHIHMGTREGKTSTVFPITAIVDALTSETGSSVLVGTDEVLLGKLKHHAAFFAEALAEVSPEAALNFEDKKEETKPTGLGRELRGKMLAESIMSGDFSADTRIEVRDSYWRDSVAKDREGERKPTRQTVYFSTDRDLVFGYQDDPKKFMAETGNMYFDEADVPYSRRSPYVRVSENQYYSPEEMVDSTVEWMRRFIISRQLQQSNFQTDAGGHSLSEGALKRLGKLNISEHFRGYNFEKPRDEDPVVKAFQEGVDIIAEKLQLSPKDKEKLAYRLANRGLAIEPADAELHYRQIGNELARLHKKKGLLYTMGQEGPKVRDSYIDQILQDHKFSSRDQMNILAIEGQFDFVPLNPVAFRTTTFQTFVKNVGAKLHCASGTLMFPDPESHKVSRSSFASFLKAATRQEIEVISPPSIKNVPEPRVYTGEQETIDNLVASVTENPTLIVSYHMNNSDRIYQGLVKRFGQEKVAYIRSKPSEGQELADYERESEKLYNDLAEGRLRAIVSSGAAGFGVDVIKDDGSFPDLHVALHGLPTNRSQLMQIYGRRGAPGDNFSWWVSEEFLDPYIMLFEERGTVVGNALGDWDRDEVKRRLQEAKSHPEKGRRLMLEILHTSEISETQDDELAILLDEYVANRGEKIDSDVKKKISEEAEGKRNFLSQYIGLPGDMKEFIAWHFPLVPRVMSGSDMRAFIINVDRYLTDTTVLADYATAWYEYRRQVVEEYMSSVNEGGELYYHQPLDPRAKDIFSPISEDPAVKGVSWGRTRVYADNGLQAEDFLSYKIGEQIFLFRDPEGEYMSFSSTKEFKDIIARLTSDKAYNLYQGGYSFLTN